MSDASLLKARAKRERRLVRNKRASRKLKRIAEP
jgi:hypothetical protein